MSASSTGITARQQLENLARREEAQHTDDLVHWPLVPGVPPDAIKATQDASASWTLEDLRIRLAPEGPQPMDASAIRQPAAEDKASALMLYVRARQKILAGSTREGLPDLEDATKLDAASADLAARAGLLQLELGRRSMAVANLRRAVLLGSQDPHVLWKLGREEARVGRRSVSIALLQRALDSTRQQPGDPVAFAIGAELAEQLANAGYLAAARSVLAAHLEIDPQQLDVRALEREPDALEVVRRRPSLLVVYGDLCSRIGEYDEARTAYGRAVQAGTLDATASLARLINAQVRSGRPAQSAITLLEDIERRDGVTTSWHAETARYLARIPALQRELPIAVDELCTTLGSRATPAVRQSLALLAASVSDDVQAERVILRELQAEPTSSSLLAALLERNTRQPPARRAEVLRRVLAIDPLACDAIGDEVLMQGVGVRDLVAWLRASKDPLDTLLFASMARRIGLPGEALARIEAIPLHDSPANTLSKIASLAAMGRMDEVEQELTALGRGPSVLDRRVRATGLDLAGRSSDALQVLTSDGASFLRDADATDLLFGVDLAMRSGAAELAEHYLTRLAELDRFDARAFEGLVVLYMPGGVLANEAKLASAMQNLRRAAPTSRTMQWLLAQESIQRGLLQQARGQLQVLISETGEPEAAVDLLLRLWEQSDKPDEVAQGVAWLRSKLEARPESTNWLLALTRLLVRQGQSDEALSLLRARSGEFPIESLLLQEEFVVRVGQRNPGEADRLAIARLRAGPRTPERTIALAEVLVRTSQPHQALATLQPVLTPGTRLSPDAQRSLMALFEKLSDPAIVTSPEAAESALQLCILIEEFNPALPVGLRLRKLELMAMAPSRTGEDLLGEIDRIVALEPAAQSAAFGRVFMPLMNSPEPRRLLRFLGAAAMRESPMSESLAYEWLVRTAAQGSIEDGTWLLEQVSTPVLAQRVLRRVGSRTGSATLPLLQADVAHALGNFASLFGRYGLSKWAFRMALSKDPSHALAANNLGFFILEYGGDLEEARRLITHAHELEPNDASILDSMGWLMYKSGQIDDLVDDSGKVLPGAATYIEAAARDPDGSTNDEVLHHLGDVLWRRDGEGDRAKAMRAWQLAEALLRESLNGLLKSPGEDQSLAGAQRRVQLASVQKNLALVSSKILAVQRGNQPELSPMSIPNESQTGVDAPILTPIPPARAGTATPNDP